MSNVVSLADHRAKLHSAAPEAEPNELALLIANLQVEPTWIGGMLRVELAEYTYKLADVRRQMACRQFGAGSPEHELAKRRYDEAFEDFKIQRVKQLFIPAPALRCLRWKERQLRTLGNSREVQLALDVDRQAFANRIASIARQQAGKASQKAAQS